MQKVFRVIVAGSRDFNDYKLLETKLDHYLKNKVVAGYNIVIVSGTARGADQLGELYASNKGYSIAKYPADWSLGKRAGYIRNDLMANNADACVCFWDGISRGTKHMIDIAERKQLISRVVMY